MVVVIKGNDTLPWPSKHWFDLSDRRRRQNDATIQGMLTLSNMVRSAKPIIFHLGFMRVHDAAHANVEGGASQRAHVILEGHKNVTEQKSARINPDLEQREDQESECAAAWLLREAAWQRLEPDDDGRVFLWTTTRVLCENSQRCW